MNLRKLILIPARWIIHGIFFKRINFLIRPKYISKKMNSDAENEFCSMKNIGNGLNSEPRKTKIIVSLTTIPKRIENTRLVISRMMNQTVKPDRIILYLDQDKRDEVILSHDFNFLVEKGLQIEYVEDIGPHTKYFYSTQQYHDDIVITVDDDMIYSHKLIETLIKSYEEFPNAVSANIVTQFVLDNGKVAPSSEWLQQFKYGIGNKKSIAYGVGGVLYPPNILPQETYNLERIKKFSFFQDDLWLKAIESVNGIDVVKAKGGDKLFGYFVTVEGSQEISLRQTNDYQDRNVKYLTQLIQEFGL